MLEITMEYTSGGATIGWGKIWGNGRICAGRLIRRECNRCCGKERKLHDTLRKAYLTELKVDLMILNSLLNEWSYDGCKIERDEDEQIDT